jgi:hypothetical protein
MPGLINVGGTSVSRVRAGQANYRGTKAAPTLTGNCAEIALLLDKFRDQAGPTGLM